MKLISILIVSIFIFASCSREPNEAIKAPVNTTEIMAHFSFSTAQMQSTGITLRSTPANTIDDSQITDMWVLQFDNSGTFLKKTYSTAVIPTAFDIALVPNVTGATSNLYFVANVGPTLPSPANEATFKLQVETITKESDLIITGTNGQKNIPMFGQLLAQSVPSTGYMATMNVTLTRLLAQIDFTYTLDPSLAPFFSLEKIRVCNVPNTMQYYTPAVGNFPTAPSSATVMTFPFEATTSPGPTTITFLLPDNRRGVGTNTPGTNEKLKTGVAFATYIELVGHTTGVQGGEEVTYRIYPGADNYNDYNIVRNTHYTLSTTLKGLSLSDKRLIIPERANCYMVKAGGSVSIPVKHVNDSDLGAQLANVTTGWTASIYWQTVSGLVTIDNSTISSGYFKVTAPLAATYGNASVVAKDLSGNVLWSWHIWVTDYDPSTVNDVLNGNTWMKCNLGATTYGASVAFAQSAGMMYQWGRKDPFLPSTTTAGAALTIYNSTISYGALTTSAISNDGYSRLATVNTTPGVTYTNQLSVSVDFPMLFLANWSGSTATAAAAAGVGIDSWGGEYGLPKSVYDPCPEGWRVPSGKVTSSTWASPWSTYTGAGITTGVSGSSSNTNYGTWSTNQIYPASGLRSATTGGYTTVGSNGSYWSATVNSANAYYLSLTSAGTNVSNGTTRPAANTVRCVKAW